MQVNVAVYGSAYKNCCQIVAIGIRVIVKHTWRCNRKREIYYCSVTIRNSHWRIICPAEERVCFSINNAPNTCKIPSCAGKRAFCLHLGGVFSCAACRACLTGCRCVPETSGEAAARVAAGKPAC